MSVLTVQAAKRSGNGVDLAGVAAAGGGDSFPTTGKELVVIKNGGGAPITLTVTTPVTCDGLAVTDLTATIGAGETRLLGPFPPAVYAADGQPGGSVALGYSSATSVTVAVVSV